MVLASVFGNDRAPAKHLVDAVAADFGYAPPRWYLEQGRAAETIGTVSGITDAARRAGLRVVLVDEHPVDVGLTAAADVVRYRCALPQLRPFVASLDPVTRRAFRDGRRGRVERGRSLVLSGGAAPRRPARRSGMISPGGWRPLP